jgi:hypothetical protein
MMTHTAYKNSNYPFKYFFALLGIVQYRITLSIQYTSKSSIYAAVVPDQNFPVKP